MTVRHCRRGTGGALLGSTCALAVMLVGCDWVDSAGNGSDGATAGEGSPLPPVQAITLDQQPLNGATAVLEDGTVTLLVPRGGDPRRDVRFESEPIASGVLDTCLAIEGFDPARAADSLEQACTREQPRCSVTSGRDDTDEALGISLSIPAIVSPVGLRYAFALGRTISGADGEPVFVEDDVRQIDLCLLSVNDKPTVFDDNFVTLEDTALQVNSLEGVLANDVDDEDTANLPLRAVLEDAPTEAASFTLRPDGGFSYTPAPSDAGADVLDTFTYRANDGTDDSDNVAIVTVRTVTANQVPQATDELPIVVGEVDEFVSFDFTDFFVDPEGSRLSFEFEQPLPDDGNLTLGSAGVLVGVPGAGDVGEYDLSLSVSDGQTRIVAPVTLLITGPVANRAPVYIAGTVFDQSIRLGQTIRPVTPLFEDPEDDVLSYRMVGPTDLSPGLVLDADTGVLSGSPRQREALEGLVIAATDPDGQTARSAPFSITIR